MTAYVEVKINSESDLPKEEGEYTFFKKNGNAITRFYRPAYDKEFFSYEYPSYLIPVEAEKKVVYEKVSVEDEIPPSDTTLTFYLPGDLPVKGKYEESCGLWWVNFELDHGDTETFALSDFTFWLREVTVDIIKH